MIERPQHQTKVELVLRALRDAILSGDMPAGKKLEVGAIAAEFGMSPTPVREALRVLQADKLIDYLPHKGAVVAGLSESDVVDVFRLRGLLEPTAVSEAMRFLDEPAMERLEDLHALLVNVPADNFTAFSEANREWHWALYHHAPSTYLAGFIQTLWDAFPWRAVASVAGRRENSLLEHEVIMRALRTRDVDAAVDAMRLHVLGSKDVLSNHPEKTRPIGQGITLPMAASF